jgi:hypothetical protein
MLMFENKTLMAWAGLFMLAVAPRAIKAIT